MKVLVTGFDPFGGEKINPAYEAVCGLPDEIAGAEIVKCEMPTVFATCAAAMEAAIVQHQPDIVVSVGQAGGCAELQVERVAINLMDARIPDNAGAQPRDEKVCEDGEDAHFVTLPVKRMVEAVRGHGIPCQLSYTAGTFVCNALLYHTLHMASRKYPGIRAGFIHVPYAPEQVTEKPSGTPSMAVADITRGLACAIAAIVDK